MSRSVELSQNTRKLPSRFSNDSSQVKQLISHSANTRINEGSALPRKSTDLGPRLKSEIQLKRPLLKYVTGDDQKAYFQTRWKPAENGKMAFCVGRKSGSATVELGFDHLDRETTYHTWKRMLGSNAKNNVSHLQCDSFLTVREEADRLDKMSNPVNRAPPYANTDGPFENENSTKPSWQIDHLDRTCTPRYEAPRRDETFKRAPTKFSRKSNINHLEPAPEKTGLCPTEHSESVRTKTGLRSVNQPWAPNWFGPNSGILPRCDEQLNENAHSSLQHNQQCCENVNNEAIDAKVKPLQIQGARHIAGPRAIERSTNTVSFMEKTGEKCKKDYSVKDQNYYGRDVHNAMLCGEQHNDINYSKREENQNFPSGAGVYGGYHSDREVEACTDYNTEYKVAENKNKELNTCNFNDSAIYNSPTCSY